MKKTFFMIACLSLFFSACSLSKTETDADNIPKTVVLLHDLGMALKADRSEAAVESPGFTSGNDFVPSPETDMDSGGEQNAEDFVIRNNVLIKYQGHEAKVVIPDGVTAIGQDAFYENKGLVNVILPEGVERIGSSAFLCCASLENVQLPKSLRYIGKQAFSRTGLIRLVLPEGLERIEEGTFSGCALLEDVELPESLYYIGKSAFSNCRKLGEINLFSAKEIDDLAFESSGLTYIDLTAVEKLGAWVFAETNIDFGGLGHLPEMEGNAFAHSRYWWEYGNGEAENTFWIVDGVLLSGQNCSGEVEIPGSVNKIAADAFTYNGKITSVHIPDSVTEIGEEAFWYCTELKTVWMEDSVTKLGAEVFFDCSQLTEIRLSNRIGVLPAGTFERCSKLTELTLPEQMTEMGSYALPFSQNKQVTVPAGISDIGYGNWEQGDVFYVTDMVKFSQSPVFEALTAFQEVKELALMDVELTLCVGEKYPLRFNSGAKATWKSSKKSVASVGTTGNIYAKKPGTAIITATIYGKEYTCVVTVVK